MLQCSVTSRPRKWSAHGNGHAKHVGLKKSLIEQAILESQIRAYRALSQRDKGGKKGRELIKDAGLTRSQMAKLCRFIRN